MVVRLIGEVNGQEVIFQRVLGDTWEAQVPSSLDGTYVISGNGAISSYSGGDTYVMTESGVTVLQPSGGSSSSGNVFTISGTGNGHNVGLSQYGAKAMAEIGCSYEEILHFYYTDVTIR